MNITPGIFVVCKRWLFQFEVIEQIIIETDAGTIFTHKLEDGRIPGLKKWYGIHPNLKCKDKIKVTVLKNVHEILRITCTKR